MFLMFIRVLAAYGIPFALGYIARGWFNRALQYRDRATFARLQQVKRKQLLSSMTKDELIEELSKHDLTER